VTKLKKEVVLPESHRQVISIARKMAEEKGMKLQIYDVSSKEGRLRALLAGVNETPTMIVRNQRITENITEEKLLSILEQTHSE
jgi:protein-disulfide isomerase